VPSFAQHTLEDGEMPAYLLIKLHFSALRRRFRRAIPRIKKSVPLKMSCLRQARL
jgi:hypothetical protein